jgi:hypothetical protein
VVSVVVVVLVVVIELEVVVDLEDVDVALEVEVVEELLLPPPAPGLGPAMLVVMGACSMKTPDQK